VQDGQHERLKGGEEEGDKPHPHILSAHAGLIDHPKGCDKGVAPDKHDNPLDTSNVSSMIAATGLSRVHFHQTWHASVL
jgi:hypothetical protein